MQKSVQEVENKSYSSNYVMPISFVCGKWFFFIPKITFERVILNAKNSKEYRLKLLRKGYPVFSGILSF
ncbi:MAG: hypothetical protein CMI27_00470 [Opitutae bacterium]|nr:hypothetical protein [Opitutae bacterium]|tara:strand:+ start:25238 stop:25444 length:207 start_codon:yes stop_codon:yes gene_type:complete